MRNEPVNDEQISYPGALRFRIARWLFIKLDRHLDRYLDKLSDEQLEELYRRYK